MAREEKISRRKMVRGFADEVFVKLVDSEGNSHKVKVPKKEAIQLERKDPKRELFDFDLDKEAGLLIISAGSPGQKGKAKSKNEDLDDEDLDDEEGDEEEEEEIPPPTKKKAAKKKAATKKKATKKKAAKE